MAPPLLLYGLPFCSVAKLHKVIPYDKCFAAEDIPHLFNKMHKKSVKKFVYKKNILSL